MRPKAMTMALKLPTMWPRAAGCHEHRGLKPRKLKAAFRFSLGAVHVLGGDLQMASKPPCSGPCSVGVEDEGAEEGGIDFEKFGLGTPDTDTGIAKPGAGRTAGGFNFNK